MSKIDLNALAEAIATKYIDSIDLDTALDILYNFPQFLLFKISFI